MSTHVLKARTKLGKYRVDRRLATGGFAAVYRARDTLEGIEVALKIPRLPPGDAAALEAVRREVRLTARLQHENILPVKNADFIDGHFVIVYPLGEQSLAERLRNRLSLETILDYTRQMLAALAHAHRHRVMHCDVKPENFILFPDNHLRLGDFGIAKVARRTLAASGSGTLGYVAPEQALGKPSFRSDVFSLGLVIYRMLSGRLPEWPYEWPLPGLDRVRRRVRPEMIALLRKALEVDHRRRFADAAKMQAAFQRLNRRRRRAAPARRQAPRTHRETTSSWKTIRLKQFLRQYRRPLEARHECRRCGGPVSEAMTACPWCGLARRRHAGESGFPAVCRRCNRGMKLDWRFCPWCYGPAYEPLSTRAYSDTRYSGRCSNPRCQRKDLMPFMRYCPWCRGRVKRRWKLPDGRPCPGCGWDVLPDYWDHCPWCARGLKRR